ncbi:hypothetical protein C8R42DRAFT_669457 [Lentinula raphanica]|nr:hypothetical protein C8R42DRAFT_669457 [Lentinula raphanica]
MAVPTPMRTISVALLLLLLASALQSGLLAAPTASSVPVPMPPIEQDIDCRNWGNCLAGTNEVHIYGIRRLDSSETGYAETKTDNPKPDEWLQIRVGEMAERQILFLGPDLGESRRRSKDHKPGLASTPKHWSIFPYNLPLGNAKPSDQSTFLIGTVRCPNFKLLEEFFGSSLDNPQISAHRSGLIHAPLKVAFPTKRKAADNNDLTYGAIEIVDRVRSFASKHKNEDFEFIEEHKDDRTVLDAWIDDRSKASKESSKTKTKKTKTKKH